MNAALRAAFLFQADACEGLDSPFMGRLLRLLAELWPTDTQLAAKVDAWQGDIGPTAASLPLRICGGLHALVLQDQDPALCAAYPPHFIDDTTLGQAVIDALQTHDAFLTSWVDNAPQTNEVRRAAVLISAAHLLADRFAMPMRLSELGASGGLNLMFDQFHLDVNGTEYGPESSVQLAPNWTGTPPPVAAPVIISRRGVDLNPLNPHAAQDQLRLLAYLWADQQDRMTRTRAAIALQDAAVDRCDAIDWLENRLDASLGQLHLIYHTIAWQYFPPKAQQRGTALIKAAGARATPDAPLAWLAFEADDQTPGAGLRLRVWPGNHDIPLGRADFHGRWVDWRAPAHLP